MRPPHAELSAKQKDKLERLAKYVIVPGLGAMAAKHIYLHRGRMTAYIQQYQGDSGFKMGLSRGKRNKTTEFAGKMDESGEIDITGSNMRWLDMYRAGRIIKRAVRKGSIPE